MGVATSPAERTSEAAENPVLSCGRVGFETATGALKMFCTIVSNNVPSLELRETVSEAIRDGIGERLGEWNVVVYQAPDCPELAVRIEGPKGLRWSWTFREQEQAPQFIQQKVAQAMLAKLLVQEESASPEGGPGY